MKRCGQVSNNISAYIDGELSEKEREKISVHLENCPECRAQLESTRKTIDKINKLPLVGLPDGLHNSIMERLENSAHTKLPDARPPAFGSSFKNVRRYATVAAAIFIVFVSLSAAGVFLDSVLSKNNSVQSPMAVYDSGAGMSAGIHSELAPEAMDMAAPLEEGISTQESYSETLTGNSDKVAFFAEPVIESMESEEMILGDAILFAEPRAAIAEGGNKISRTYYITIETEDFDQAVKLLEEMPGNNISSEAGGSDYNRWTNVRKRVDAGYYENAKELLQALGTTKDAGEYSEDLTNDLQDIEAKLLAKETEKDRLNGLLGSSKTLMVLTQVESRLSQVETEIEDLKGQIRYYNNQVSLPMLEINLRSFVKESAVDRVQPNFGTQVRYAFYRSVNFTLDFMQGLLLVLSYVGFPVVVLLVICILIFFIWRKARSKRRTRKGGGE